MGSQCFCDSLSPCSECTLVSHLCTYKMVSCLVRPFQRLWEMFSFRWQCVKRDQINMRWAGWLSFQSCAGDHLFMFNIFTWHESWKGKKSRQLSCENDQCIDHQYSKYLVLSLLNHWERHVFPIHFPILYNTFFYVLTFDHPYLD